jgi:hypothetical protein
MMKKIFGLFLAAALLFAVGFMFYALHKKEMRGLYLNVRALEIAAAAAPKMPARKTQPVESKAATVAAPKLADKKSGTVPAHNGPLRSVLEKRNLNFAKGPRGAELKESKTISCPRIMAGRVLPGAECERHYYLGGGSSVLIFSGGVLQARYDYNEKNGLLSRAFYFSGRKYGRGAGGGLVPLDGEVNVIEIYDGQNPRPAQVITFSAPGVIEDAAQNDFAKDTAINYTFRKDKTLAYVWLAENSINGGDASQTMEIIFSDKYHDSVEDGVSGAAGMPAVAEASKGSCRIAYENGLEKKCSWKLDTGGRYIVDGKMTFLPYSAFPAQSSYCETYPGSCKTKAAHNSVISGSEAI